MSTTASLPLIAGHEPARSGFGLRTRVGSLLFCFLTFEAALLGSGRLLQIGPVTAKMILYALALLYTGWSLISFERVRYSTILLLVSFGLLLTFCIVNGLAHRADMQYIGQDVSPLISFLVLPFYELTIRNKRDIRTTFRIIVTAALTMAACYAAIILGLSSGRISFETLYRWVSRVGGEDLVFEGDSGRVFYKGSLFIGIALFFLVFQKSRWAKVGAFVLFLSLFMVGARGFFLALALCGVLYVFVGPISATKKLVTGFAAVSLAVVLVPRVFAIFGDKSASNYDRLIQISEVYDRTALGTVLTGHGLGVGVPIRPGHMEIMYLEIFHKQGLVGLLWWATLVGIAALRWKRAVKSGRGQLAYPLLLSIAFICIESATNPFLDNPIGLYAFIICYVSLGVLAEPSNSSDKRHLANY